ncbi:hypothetical protein LEN26_020683 [Aphanomyces euteiches]|nr:hypothetical protein LEN26_020683 [Aphanomyces euteiches]KAH9105956.1 hypothetical protein AeMF1_018335 [Aphanomyces euteiches]KAH9184279.1 hypothetical protein AeNC1_013741 [Aphanomyces euteiches]
MKSMPPSRTRLEAIAEEWSPDDNSADVPTLKPTTAASRAQSFVHSLHKNWLANRDTQRKLVRSNSNVAILHVFDIVTQGVSIVCLELGKGILVFVVVAWTVAAVLCIGLYVHMYHQLV